MRRALSIPLVFTLVVAQLTQPVAAFWWYLATPAFTIATRVAPMAAGLMTRGTTWLAGSLAADAAAWKIGETVTWVAGGALYAAYLMQGTSTSPQTNGGAPIRAVINLKPNDKRMNPDPVKWDDATQVNPTPKTTLPASSAVPATSGLAPSTYTPINASMASGDIKQWTFANGSPFVLYKLTLPVFNPSQASFLNKDFQPVATGLFVVGQWVWYKVYSTIGSPTDYLYQLTVATTAGATRAVTNADLYGCSAGYSYVSGQCNLADSTQVIKVDTPCEIVEVNGSWTLDSQNPNCTGFNAAGFTVTGTTARMNFTDGTSTAVARNTDGGLTITDANPTTGTTAITTGPFNVPHGAYPVTTVNQSAPGTGGNGSSGSCGGTGQVACAVDTSGFTGQQVGLAAAITSAGQALDAPKNAFDALSGSPQAGDHGITRDGLFSLAIPNVVCAPFTFAIPHLPSIPINLCDDGPFGSILGMLRWIEAALLSWAAMWYLWRRFTGADTSSTAAGTP